ncbi:hypothetical protein DWX83_07405 [Ruminococcus sp. AF21-42]|jgi:hypothetical protein|uniref:putative signal transducing protein n=1 Tax=Blautia luti TaxID=89014 RepID=UPI000E4E7B09|nr:DUF2007 domain-containing protein [Blautia luti]RHQ91695.1 hypothetical protein DWX83_07405 [Ruminococcus sp. AF21-42]
MFGHKKEKDASEPVILMNVAGNYELGLVKSILEEHQIPCFLQDHATGGYMRLYAASSLYGTDIYVSPADLDRARELTSVLDLEHPVEISEEELAQEALAAGKEEEEV